MFKNYEQFELDLEADNLNGLYLDVPENEYRTTNHISKSDLDMFERSPAHYAYQQTKEATRAMEIGTAIHTAILEPNRFNDEYVMLENVTKRTQKEYKDAVKIHGSEKVLTKTESENVKGMFETVKTNIQAANLITSPMSKTEVSCFAVMDGVKVKCRFDLLNFELNTAIDLKKTQDIRQEQFSKSIANYRYHVQCAFYKDILKLLTGLDIDFQFLVVEEHLPHANKLYTLDFEGESIGRFEYKENLDQFKLCNESNNFPYPDNASEEISLPFWKINEFDNKLEIV